MDMPRMLLLAMPCRLDKHKLSAPAAQVHAVVLQLPKQYKPFTHKHEP
jgi:hypothetical protein